MNLSKLNCAGQECPEREGCRRYDMRIPDRKVKVRDTEQNVYEWASFDLERIQTGDCVQRVQKRAA